MDKIDGSSPTPTYKDEFKHSVDLFERSLNAYQTSKMDNQKQAFVEIMGKASHVMDETAPMVLNKSGQDHLSTLKKHYQDFITNPSSDMMNALQKDINELKNT